MNKKFTLLPTNLYDTLMVMLKFKKYTDNKIKLIDEDYSQYKRYYVTIYNSVHIVSFLEDHEYSMPTLCEYNTDRVSIIDILYAGCLSKLFVKILRFVESNTVYYRDLLQEIKIQLKILLLEHKHAEGYIIRDQLG